MLTSLREVLRAAQAGGYAVPAFDCVEDVMVRTILETCEARRCPAILMGLPGPDLAGHGWFYVPGLVRAVADRHHVPVVLHLDHATELDDIKRAMDEGYTSVMIDGSRLPFAQNVRLTRAAVAIAHARGVSVEAELGHVGGSDVENTSYAESVLTEAKEARRFVGETGVDALAVSIGTAHGLYRQSPQLNFPRLDEIRAATDVPLVLHGGSGTPVDQLQEAVRHGVTKLNIYADNRVAMGRGLLEAARSLTRPAPLPRELFAPIRQRLAETVSEKIRMCFAEGRV
jgi:fructose-bisphosphate aldolase class II